jgi:hypothetical protein
MLAMEKIKMEIRVEIKKGISNLLAGKGFGYKVTLGVAGRS